MMPVPTRWCFILLTLFLLSGCGLVREHLQPKEETIVFKQGLEQYTASGDLTTLTRLPQEYPQGEWRTAAETIISLAKQQEILQKKELECTRCQQEKDALTQDNKMLETTLKQLKEVLIDTELKAK